jgi:hypothetical protein
MTAALNDTEKAKVAELTGLGLPEAAAIVSATSITAGPNPSGGKPCRLFGKMKVSLYYILLLHCKYLLMLFIHRSCVCCSVLATSVVSHQIKADGNVDELTAALTAYGNASRAAPGNTGCDYSIANGELIMFEVFDSPNAMHIRTCTFFLFSVSFFGGFRVRVRLLSLCFRFLRFSNIYLVFLFFCSQMSAIASLILSRCFHIVKWTLFKPRATQPSMNFGIRCATLGVPKPPVPFLPFRWV